MPQVLIPTRSDVANYYQRTVLDGVVYNLRFYYNDRDNSWYLSISDVNGTPIRTGIKLIPNFPLMFRMADFTVWAGGILWLADARPIALPPVLADMGVNSLLIYETLE